ncbi:uncharacterized protein LOC110676187 [Aedes aegypti]|uniref:Uncharacterized protein n=1 Tax=Aedes aegypti TaxID=7159 RepID=A0A6I8U2B4_AEDAE|nr:uncharacterized protein LOC110676187 [Aedes aegypti]
MDVLLQAAELAFSQYSEGSAAVRAIPTVACYEEIAADLSFSGISTNELSETLIQNDQSILDSRANISSASPPEMNKSLSVSFRNVFSSTSRLTPLPRQPLFALDEEEESPLDLSINSIDNHHDAPLNLIAKPIHSVECSAKSVFQMPLNLTSSKRTDDDEKDKFTPKKPPNSPRRLSEENHVLPDESENARSENILVDDVESKGRFSDQLQQKPLDGSSSEARQGGRQHEAASADHFGNNDLDENDSNSDDDDYQDGEIELLNDFSIMEYFEPYRIDSMNADSEPEDLIDNPIADSDCENVAPGKDLGFKELNDSNITKRGDVLQVIIM